MGKRNCKYGQEYYNIREKKFESKTQIHKKMEGNSRILTNRITLEPKILSFPSSTTIKKSKGSKSRRNVFKFGQYSTDVVKKLRRSRRILDKHTDLNTTSTDILLNNINDNTFNAEENNDLSFLKEDKDFQQENCNKPFAFKSIFKEILTLHKKRFGSNQNNYSTHTTKPDSVVDTIPTNSFYHKNQTQPSVNNNFSCNIVDKTNVIYKNCVFDIIRSRYHKRMHQTNDILSGNLEVSLYEEEKIEVENNHKGPELQNADKDESFQLFSESDWSFMTPPMQKSYFIPAGGNDAETEPAILYNDEKESHIYEINKKIKIDLNQYSNKRDIVVDNRWMNKIATIDKECEAFDGKKIVFSSDNKENINNEDKSLMFNFKRSNSTEEHFEAVTSRPKKSVRFVSRLDDNFRDNLGASSSQALPFASPIHQKPRTTPYRKRASCTKLNFEEMMDIDDSASDF